MLDLRRVLASKPKPPTDAELTELWTPWGEKVAAGEKDVAPCTHPRPQCARERWASLNGMWECALVAVPDAAAAWRVAEPPVSPGKHRFQAAQIRAVVVIDNGFGIAKDDMTIIVARVRK